MDVLNLFTGIYHERRREIVLEDLPLIVADDDRRVRTAGRVALCDFGHRRLAGVVALRLRFEVELIREPAVASGQQRGKIVVRAAEGMARIALVGVRTLMPLIGRRRQQRTVRDTKSTNHASHLVLPCDRLPSAAVFSGIELDRPRSAPCAGRDDSALRNAGPGIGALVEAPVDALLLLIAPDTGAAFLDARDRWLSLRQTASRC